MLAQRFYCPVYELTICWRVAQNLVPPWRQLVPYVGALGLTCSDCMGIYLLVYNGKLGRWCFLCVLYTSAMNLL